MVYNLIILFLLAFCFPIPIIGNSVYLAIFIAFFRLLYNGQIGKTWKDIKSGYICHLIIWTLGLVLIGIIFTIINGAFEFSRVIALFSLFIGLITTIIVYPSLNIIGENPRQLMEKMLVYVFLIQSFISIISFVSPGFKNIISNFQFPDDANLAEESYAGVRGLALSGRLYFEFAATCGLITVFQINRIVEGQKTTVNSIISLLLIVICGFFAGRTALVGLAIGIAYIFLAKAGLKFKVKFFIRFLLITTILCALIFIVIPSGIKEFITEHLLPWVFDVFIKYFETGSTESSHSFNALNEMYHDVKISIHEWFIGSGKYIESSGRYYGHVDAGYLRQILYWGVIGSIISFIYTIKIFEYPFKISKSNWNQRLFIITILAYTFIVHYKGDLLSVSRFYYVVIYLYLLSIWQSNKGKEKQYLT